MKKYSEFHDGWFEGLWINDEAAHVFLSTEGRERFVVVAETVEALYADGIRAGNIILDVLLRDAAEVLLSDIQTLYQLPTGPVGETQGADLLEKARRGEGRLLEINPSYGASCLLLAGSIEIVPQGEWLKKYGFGSLPGAHEVPADVKGGTTQ
jgi:hypothetical protein